MLEHDALARRAKSRKLLRNACMVALVALATAGGFSVRSCSHVGCRSVSYLPGACG